MRSTRPILIAESDFLTGTLLVAALEAAGRRTLVARDGDAVLDLLDAQAPDLLILSMNLARPGGIQMLRRLQQKDARVRILATTRFGQANLRANARRLGVTEFLEFPFSPAELTAQIDRILGAER